MVRMLIVLGLLFTATISADECQWQPPLPCELEPSWVEKVHIEVEAFYGKVNSEGFDYFIKQKGVTRTKSDIKAMNLDWSPGSRIGFDIKLPRYEWELGAYWFHFESASSSSTKLKGKNGENISFSPTTVSGFSETLSAGQHARSRGRLHSRYEIFDVQLGKTCWLVDEVVSLRPFLGVRIVDIHANLKNKSTIKPSTNTSLITMHVKNEHKGVGFRAGFEANYAIVCGFSAFGGLAGNLIWGNAEFRNKYTTALANLEVYKEHLRENVRLIRPILDMQIGAEWKFMICDCTPITLRAGWEAHCYFDQFRYFTRSHRGQYLIMPILAGKQIQI